MNNLIDKLVIFLCVLFITACAGHVDLKPAVIADADRYTEDGLQAYAETDWHSAEILFSKALSLQQSIDNLQGVLFNHINLVEVALATRNFQSLRLHLERAYEISETPAFSNLQPRIFLLYALSELKQGKITAATYYLQKILPEFKGLYCVVNPDALQLAAIATQTDIAFISKQNEKLWSQRFFNALTSSNIDQPLMKARLIRFQSDLLKQDHDFMKAESLLQQALAMYKKNQFRPGIASTLSELGQLYSEQKQSLKARDAYKRALAVFRFLKDKRKMSQLKQKLEQLSLNTVNQAQTIRVE